MSDLPTGERLSDPRAWKPGDRAIWRHEERGGYGYISRVPVEVVSVGKKLVRIRGPRLGGGTKETNVSPCNLLRVEP